MPKTEENVRPMRPWHYCVLLLPYAGLLVPALYARWSPAILGMPFFYAYQFGWVVLSAGLTAIVYRSMRRGKA